MLVVGHGLYPALFYPDSGGFSLAVAWFSLNGGYPLSAKPAPQRLRIPLALGMPVKYSG